MKKQEIKVAHYRKMTPLKSDLPIPPLLAMRPKWKGFPIPYIALTKPDGTSDFRVVDERMRVYVMRQRLCQLCGEMLLREIYFVAGVNASAHNQFWEPGMHLDCLLYAMQICPFIVGKTDHADIAQIQAKNPGIPIGGDSTYSNKREPEWVITKASNYSLYRPPHVLAHADPIVFVHPPLYPDVMSRGDWVTVRQTLREGRINPAAPA